MQVNLNKNVFDAINNARSDNTIDSIELAKIKTKMAEDGISRDEQQVLNAIQMGNEITIANNTERATLSPNQLHFPAERLSSAELDQSFFLKLAELSEPELATWYDDHQEDHQLIQNAYNAMPAPPAHSAQERKLEDLGSRLQRLSDQGTGRWARNHFAHKSAETIAQEFLTRITDTQNVRPVDNIKEARLRAIRSIADDLRIISAEGGDPALEEKVFAALEKALKHLEPNRYAKVQTINAVDFVEAVSELSGPGSAEVKARVLKMSMELYKPPQYDSDMRGPFAEKLLLSDPNGVVGVLEYMADANPGDKLLLDKALDSIVKLHADDPDQAADVLGTIISASADQYTQAVMAEPFDANRAEDLAHQVGYLLKAAENSVGTMVKAAKKKIDEGAFIAKIFTKGVAKLSGVKAIEKAGDAAINFQKKREYKEVEKWEKGMIANYQRLLNRSIMARAPQATSGSDVMVEFRRRQNRYEDDIQSGYTNHADEERSTAERTHR